MPVKKLTKASKRPVTKKRPPRGKNRPRGPSSTDYLRPLAEKFLGTYTAHAEEDTCSILFLSEKEMVEWYAELEKGEHPPVLLRFAPRHNPTYTAWVGPRVVHRWVALSQNAGVIQLVCMMAPDDGESHPFGAVATRNKENLYLRATYGTREEAAASYIIVKAQKLTALAQEIQSHYASIEKHKASIESLLAESSIVEEWVA